MVSGNLAAASCRFHGKICQQLEYVWNALDRTGTVGRAQVELLGLTPHSLSFQPVALHHVHTAPIEPSASPSGGLGPTLGTILFPFAPRQT